MLGSSRENKASDVPCRIGSAYVGSTGEATRTPDLRIMRPQPKSRNGSVSNSLGQAAPTVGHLLATDTCKMDPDLAAVIEAWDRLPEAIRAGIVAMVKAAC